MTAKTVQKLHLQQKKRLAFLANLLNNLF